VSPSVDFCSQYRRRYNLLPSLIRLFQAKTCSAYKKKVVRKKTAQRLILIAFVNFYVGDCADPPLLPGGCAEQSVAPPPAHFGSLTIPKQPPKR
jgi:hypothetical protein